MANVLNFNIATRQLDIGSLDHRIECREECIGDDFYIFMSQDTFSDLRATTMTAKYGVVYTYCRGSIYHTYHRHRVFIDTTKEYGEIEFR